MTNILITSSVLIVAVLILRLLFRKTISRRAQYAMWGLVLLRLVFPLDLPWADFSVLTAAQPIRQEMTHQANMHVFYSDPVREMTPEELLERNIQVPEVPTADGGGAMILVTPPKPGSAMIPPREGYLVRDPDTDAVTLYTHMAVGPWEFLDTVWRAGMVAVGAWFVLSNAWFYWRLRKSRTPYEADSACRVYLVGEGVLPSPCLFLGAIYLTPAAVETPERLRHVLAHEETHARHLDPLWSLLRCVCLSVYWFDPLVWAAALASRADCELACDEGALERLGEDQRIPYGQTLLSLIPVRRGLENPLLSATTMTSGKRRLKDRVTRIAQKPRQFMAAVLTAAVLVAAVSACTFTGESPIPVDQGPIALTGAELRWFNEEFFNSSATDQGRLYFSSGDGTEMYYNVRNQFANPINLYNNPEDIDLLELLYCEGDMYSEEDYQALGIDPAKEACPSSKITVEQIDAILQANMGLTLEQTNKVNFVYDYNETLGAYVCGGGDTNYCGELDFLCGTREGREVKLYHNSNFSGSSWYCVTLFDRGEGEYWFDSNQACEHPAIPPVLPDGEPETTISLRDLEPYVPEAVTVEAHPNHYVFNYETCYANWNMDGHSIMVYRAADGVVYAAYVVDDVYYVFLSGLSEERGHVFFYNDLFGHDGFYVDYYGQYDYPSFGPIRDYYYFDDAGVLTLLARCQAEVGPAPCPLDLDGDGTDELVSARQIFFQRDGQVYEARLDELLLAACPELEYWEGCIWDPYGRYCAATGLSGGTKETSGYTWARHIYFDYFDGENLRVYRPEPPTVIDHMVEGADAGVPAEVVQAARDYIQSRLEPQDDGTWLLRDNEHGNYAIDDWRVVRFIPPNPGEYEGCEDWRCIYELHTPQPKEVVWAGGLYVTEDGWVGPFTYQNR